MQELTECSKPVYDTITAIELKKFTAGEFFGEWPRFKVQLQRKSVNNASSLGLCFMPWKTILLSNAACFAAIYVDPMYQVLLKCYQKTVAQAHLAALWRRLQMLRESVDTIDVESLESCSESENGSAPTYGVDIINEILSTSDACNASSSQSPRSEQNVTEMIKCFNNQAHLFRTTNILE